MMVKTSYIIFFLLLSTSLFSQVGIGTSSPNGMLEVNSSSMGLVYPSVNLVSTSTQTITNPNGGALSAGTTVYNNATTSSGSTSVYPGIYVWDGASVSPKWIPQFSKRDIDIFVQRADVRTTSSGGDESILFNNTAGSLTSSFTPMYSGEYLVEVYINYGGGEVDNAGSSNSNNINFNAQEGEFDFTFNGTTTTVDVRSYSADNNRYSTNHSNASSQARFVVTETLTHSSPYTFTLTCNQEPAEGFIDNGDGGSGGSGRGYATINSDVKCTIEFTYIGE